jgi:RNA polymerase sigma-70 factor, ECF subfamily
MSPRSTQLNHTMAMPPIPSCYGGRDAVAAFLRSRPLASGRRWRLVPARANGQLAFGHYLWDGKDARFVRHGINVLTLRGDRVAGITAFLTPAAFGRFGLPDAVRP